MGSIPRSTTAATKARQRLRQRIARAPGRGRATQVFGVAQAEQAQVGGVAVQVARDFTGRFPGVELRAPAFDGSLLAPVLLRWWLVVAASLPPELGVPRHF